MSTRKTNLGYTLKRTQHTMRLCLDEALKPLNLNTPQYAVLAVIDHEPGISNADLARRSFVTPQTMHGIVSTLEKAGLLKRTEDPEHGRILRTKLTKQGKNIIKQAYACVEKVEKEMTRTINKKEILLLEKLLLQCTNNLTLWMNENKV